MRWVARNYAIEILNASGGVLGAELVPCVDESTAITLARTAIALFRGGSAARVYRVEDGRRWEGIRLNPLS